VETEPSASGAEAWVAILVRARPGSGSMLLAAAAVVFGGSVRALCKRSVLYPVDKVAGSMNRNSGLIVFPPGPTVASCLKPERRGAGKGAPVCGAAKPTLLASTALAARRKSRRAAEREYHP